MIPILISKSFVNLGLINGCVYICNVLLPIWVNVFKILSGFQGDICSGRYKSIFVQIKGNVRYDE